MKKKITRIIALTLILVMATSVMPMALCFTGAAVEGTNDVLTGDVNGDGTLDIFDYVMLKSICLGEYEPAESELALADVNGDGEVDVFDYAWVKSACMSETVEHIDFVAHSFNSDFDYEDKKTYIIGSLDEYNAFAEYYINKYDEYTCKDLNSFVDELPENYFEEKALVISAVIFPYVSGFSKRIESISMSNNTLTVNVIYEYGNGNACMVDPRLMVAEVSKADIGDCTSCTTNYVEIYYDRY